MINEQTIISSHPAPQPLSSSSREYLLLENDQSSTKSSSAKARHHHCASDAAAVVVVFFGGEMFKMRRLTEDNIWKAQTPLWRLMFREKRGEGDSSGDLELGGEGKESTRWEKEMRGDRILFANSHNLGGSHLCGYIDVFKERKKPILLV